MDITRCLKFWEKSAIINMMRKSPPFWTLHVPSAAFTLAELLIALAILGVIATFTIPKILQSQQDSRYKAVAKEAAGTISQAYQAYQLKYGLSANMRSFDLTQFMNYVKVDSTSTIDDANTFTSWSCANAGEGCIRLHNGSMLWFDSYSFGGTASTNAVPFMVDPDGVLTDSTTNGPGKSVQFFLYYNGRLTSWANIYPNTYSQTNSWGSCNNCDPGWFNWN